MGSEQFDRSISFGMRGRSFEGVLISLLHFDQGNTSMKLINFDSNYSIERYFKISLLYTSTLCSANDDDLTKKYHISAHFRGLQGGHLSEGRVLIR